MRKHDVRKWLHAILDLLPVILIPVFMIYSHRHEINSGSIQVQDKIAVDFNQQVVNGDFTSSDEWFSTNCSLSIDDNSAILTDNGNNIANINLLDNFNFTLNHIYYFKFDYSFGSLGGANYIGLRYPQYYSSQRVFLSSLNSDTDYVYKARFNLTSIESQTYGIRVWFSSRLGNFDFHIRDVQCFDLTQMFGVGNEPTITEFDNLFTDGYYSYVLSDKKLINGDLVTYNDTDIMSQMTYQLYNSVDKYFNMGNVFNLNGVYDWFNLNIFNGSAPIYIFIVWQIALYEFVMDLLFLLYGLFMWFIDMVERIMDKPFKSIK